MADEHEDAANDYTLDSPSTSAPTVQEEAVTDIPIEADRYGEAKPKRIVIRAKITHDQD